MTITLDGTTGISSVGGSAASPSVRGSDSNSGIVYAADAIKFSTGGTERFTITNTGFTGITQGITEFDMWRVTSNFSGAGIDITSNWERADTDFEKIGTGLTESSGIFTFPSTGKWLVGALLYSWNSGDVDYVGIKIQLSGDSGGSYTTRVEQLTNTPDSTIAACVYAECGFDITSTSVNLMKFRTVAGSSISYNGATDQQKTGFTAIKLGDT